MFAQSGNFKPMLFPVQQNTYYHVYHSISTLAIFAMSASYYEEPGLNDLATRDFEHNHLDPLLASLRCERL